MKSMTEETFDQLYNFLMKRVSPDAAKGFKKAPNKADWINKYWDKLNEDSDWAETYKSKEDIFGNPSKTFPSLWEQYEGKILTDAQFDVLKKKYPWIRREELNDWFNKTNEYKDFYNEEAKKQAGINRRTKEIKEEWSFPKKVISSDYEQQRYINEPQEATFGKEAPGFFGSSVGSKADLISGGLAATADLIPHKLATPIGPTIRTGRDLFHYFNPESKYKKDLSEIWSDAKYDYGTNLAAYGLANARKWSRLASKLSEPNVQRAFDKAINEKAIREGIAKLDALPETTTLTEFRGAIKSLPDSPLKDDLLNATANYTQESISEIGTKADKVLEGYRKSLIPNIQDSYEMMVNTPGIKPPKPNSFMEQVLDVRANPIKGPLNKLEYGLLRGADLINVGKPGQVIVQAGEDIHGRGSKPDVVQTPIERQEQEDTIERIKNNYSLLWSPNHKPQGYDNPLIKEAYDRWIAENGYIPGVK